MLKVQASKMRSLLYWLTDVVSPQNCNSLGVFLAVRSLLTPPKSLAALSTLRDGSWKDGCY